MVQRIGRIARTVVGLWLGAWLSVLACGKTAESPSGGGEAGEAGSLGAAGRATGGAAGDGDGAASGAGGTRDADGGEAGAATCVDGAPCECDDRVGTFRCADASGVGECSCPPAELCEKKLESCFEPCGGEPYGAWVLEETCLRGETTGDSCSGGFMTGAATVNDLRLRILEDQAVAALGNEGWDIEARVPLTCLGIESVKRCADATFYVAPLLFELSAPLTCAGTECGDCACSGRLSAFAGFGHPGLGAPWQPGSETLSFGGIQVPYCVQGDTLWVGGDSGDGSPKASYKFRRSSCTGAPLPCEERVAPACGTDGSCYAGHCVGLEGNDCEGFGVDLCGNTPGCAWDDLDQCFGSTPERCDFTNCDATPGCSWGEAAARCGGEVRPCFTYEPEECPSALGCELSSCVWGDGPDEPVNCYPLTASECTKATGCTVSGQSCSGFTRCWDQTDAQACSALGCWAVDSPRCDGKVAVRCSDLDVEACASLPGCRVEW